jgi:glycosyltransferase involved in cell wall biosynthesis
MLNGTISVVMPAYNEAPRIIGNLREVAEALCAAGYDFEIVLVDDGSPDKTYLEALKFAETEARRVRVVHYDKNLGKGNALVCGTWFARGDYVVFLDADMDLPPAQLPTFFDIMRSTGADAVIGSKRHRDSKVDYPFMRRLYSVVYYSLVRVLFGLPVKDSQTGLKVFRSEVLERVLPRILAKRFAFDIELLANAHRLGYRIVDGPVTLEFRRKVGRIKLRDALNILIDTMAIYYRMYILHYYDRLDTIRLHDLRLSDSIGGLRVVEVAPKA